MMALKSDPERRVSVARISFVSYSVIVSDMKRERSVADGIMRKVLRRKAGQRTCTARDFKDLGSRDAVDQALGRLVRIGRLRRIGRGLYEAPRWSSILKRPAPVDLDAAVATLARRDGVRIVPDGSVSANQLGLTNAVPARPSYLTDGTSRTLKIGGHTVRLRHASPRRMRWAGRPAAPVVQALHWLGPDAARDARVVAALRRHLPEEVKRSLAEGRHHLPGWMVPIARQMTADSAIPR